ncbi:MAG: hypothetical protein R6V85_04995 [Polyangia bacterium]
MDDKQRLQLATNDLPFPVAYPLRAVYGSRDRPIESAVHLLHAVEEHLRFFGTCLIVDAAHQAAKNKRVRKALGNVRLGQTTIGAHVAAITHLAPVLTDPFLRELPSLFEKTRWQRFTANLAVVSEKRNRFSHPIHVPGEREARKTVGDIWPAFAGLLDDTRFLARYETIVIDERTRLTQGDHSLRVRSLRGFNNMPSGFRIRTSMDLDPGCVVAVDREADAALVLSPIYVAHGAGANLDRGLYAYSRQGEGGPEYDRPTAPDAGLEILTHTEQLLNGRTVEQFLNAAPNERMPLRGTLGLQEDAQHRWIQTASMGSLSGASESSTGDSTERVAPQSRAAPSGRRKRSRLTLAFVAIGVAALLAIGISLGAMLFEPPQPRDFRVSTLSPPIVGAVETYRLFRQALVEKESALHFGTYPEIVPCFYDVANLPRTSIKEGGRRKYFPPYKLNAIKAGQFAVLASSMTTVALGVRGETGKQIARDAPFGKIVELTQVDGRWWITSEISRDQHRCYQHGEYFERDPAELDWYYFWPELESLE